MGCVRGRIGPALCCAWECPLAAIRQYALDSCALAYLSLQYVAAACVRPGLLFGPLLAVYGRGLHALLFPLALFQSLVNLWMLFVVCVHLPSGCVSFDAAVLSVCCRCVGACGDLLCAAVVGFSFPSPFFLIACFVRACPLVFLMPSRGACLCLSCSSSARCP